MPRRVTLPGADELFRATTVDAAVREAEETAEVRGRADPTAGGDETGVSVSRVPAKRHSATGGPSGRQKHDEKITVYVSPEELIDLERSRLILRSSHSLAVDRGRIVREALAVVLADLEAKGESSILVRRLRG